MNEETRDAIKRVQTHAQGLITGHAPHQVPHGQDLLAVCEVALDNSLDEMVANKTGKPGKARAVDAKAKQVS